MYGPNICKHSDLKKHVKQKIRILERDFKIKLTEEDTNDLYSSPTCMSVDRIARKIIIREMGAY